MKTSALGTIFGALALGGVAVLYLQVDELSDEVRSLSRRTVAERETPVPDSDRLVSRGPGRTSRAVPTDAPASASEPVDEEAVAGTLEERVRRIERDLKTVKGDDRTSTWYPPMRAMGRQRVRSMDQLATRLELTPTQRARVQQAIDNGKQRIADVMKIPDASGKSPEEHRAERRKKLQEAIKKRDKDGLLSFAGGMFGHRNKEIPGRNTTYGQEIDRIKNETRDEVSSALSPEQQKTFGETNIDPMVGAESGMQISMFTGSHDGAGATGEAVIVETGAVIEEVAELGPPAPPEKDDK